MKYIIDKENRPVYLQLYVQLRDDIVNGIYPYNSKLPSKRNLAQEAGVSTITVEHAYALLCDEGYAEAKERSGYMVTFQRDDGFAASTKTLSAYHSAYQSKQDYPEFSLSIFSKTMIRIICQITKFPKFFIKLYHIITLLFQDINI